MGVTGNPEAEGALRSILEKADRQLEPLRSRQGRSYWRASITGSDRDVNNAREAEKKYRLTLSNQELFEELQARLAEPGVQDLTLRRWAKLLLIEMQPHLLPEEVILDLVEREKDLVDKVNKFRPEIDGDVSTPTDAGDVLHNSDDAESRREAWESMRQIGVAIAEDLRELVRARNVAARTIGYPDHYRMMLHLQEIDEARLFSSLGNFASASEDTYRRAKAQIDRILSDKYEVEATDLQPWHYSDPTFEQVPPVAGADLDPIFAGKETPKWAMDYFKGVGLPIDAILSKSDFYERKKKLPHPYCVNVDRAGDVRVSLNYRDNTHWAVSTLHEFGHAAYHLNVDPELPHTLRRAAHPSVTEGVGALFERQVHNIEWLIEQFALTGEQIRQLERPLAMERPLRMAVRGRWALVMTHFERGLYRDPDQDQQQRWWDLIQRFQLIRRPGDRKEMHDWAANPAFIISPVYYHNYLLGEWIASQLRATMSEQLDMDANPSWAYDRRIGKWLTEHVFQHGAQWHYAELVRNATGSSPRPDTFINDYLS